MILDEATSALDPKSEKEVQAAISNVQELEKKAGNKLTIIMIAHRLQTIETAQNLLYIENPKSIIAGEKGTPEYDDILHRLKTETYKHQDNADKAGNHETAEPPRTAEKTNHDIQDRSTATPLLK